MSYTYEYPRMAVTVDAVVLAKQAAATQVLLILRKHDPCADCWALPGGFVDMEETSEEAAYRELEEETGINGVALKRLDVFDALGRDPRGRTISIVYIGYTNEPIEAKGNDDAKDAQWFDVTALPALAFDHLDIISKALQASH